MKKKLKDLLDYEQPTKYIVKTENYSDEYNLPVLTAGKSFVLGYTNETEGVFKGKNEPVIIFDDFTRDTKYVDFDFKVKSSAMKILHKHNKDDSLKYLHYALNNIKYVPFSHKRLWISDFSNMEIDYPSPEIQNSIATELDTIRSAIDNKKQQLALLDEAVKSEFVEMFGDPVNNPMNWEIKPMGELLSLLTDFSSNGSYKTLDSNVIMYDEPNYALMIRTTDLESGDFSNNVKWVDEKAYNLLSKSKVFGKEIIMNKIGSAGKVYLMPELNRPVTLGRNAFLFRYKENINSVYIYFLLTSEYGKNEIKPYIRGAVTKTITKDDARKIRIPVPPLSLQNDFAAFVKQIDKSKFVVKQQIADLQELLDSKMQEYFS